MILLLFPNHSLLESPLSSILIKDNENKNKDQKLKISQ